MDKNLYMHFQGDIIDDEALFSGIVTFNQEWQRISRGMRKVRDIGISYRSKIRDTLDSCTRTITEPAERVYRRLREDRVRDFIGMQDNDLNLNITFTSDTI